MNSFGFFRVNAKRSSASMSSIEEDDESNCFIVLFILNKDLNAKLLIPLKRDKSWSYLMTNQTLITNVKCPIFLCNINLTFDISKFEIDLSLEISNLVLHDGIIFFFVIFFT